MSWGKGVGSLEQSFEFHRYFLRMGRSHSRVHSSSHCRHCCHFVRLCNFCLRHYFFHHHFCESIPCIRERVQLLLQTGAPQEFSGFDELLWWQLPRCVCIRQKVTSVGRNVISVHRCMLIGCQCCYGCTRLGWKHFDMGLPFRSSYNNTWPVSTLNE